VWVGDLVAARPSGRYLRRAARSLTVKYLSRRDPLGDRLTLP